MTEINHLEFVECDMCRAKTGMPVLCTPCLSNRALIASLKEDLRNVRAETKQREPCVHRPSEDSIQIVLKVDPGSRWNLSGGPPPA